MPTINQLPTVTQVSGGDQLPLFVTNQGDARRCSVTTLIEYIQVNLGAVTCASVQTTPVRFDQLPNAVGNAGARAFITNCNTTTFNAAAAGGGSSQVPVFSNGTAWFVG
jgi:hypothetical protein